MTNRFSKNPDTLTVPGSVIKLATALVARNSITDAMLDNLVVVTAADMHPPTTAGLQAGDVISWRDLFYGLLVPSGNDAALAMARLIGDALPSPGGVARFLGEMNSQLAAWGMAGAVAGSPHGVDTTTRLSARHAAQLMTRTMGDSFLRAVCGTLTRAITITGANARAYSVVHTINPSGTVQFPEFIAGKTGTMEGSYSCVMAWSNAGGGYEITAVMGSQTSNGRFEDLRSVMDYEQSFKG